MAAEAKVKLTLDTSDAQRSARLMDEELNKMGKGKKSSSSPNTSKSSETESDKFINSQQKFIRAFENFMSQSQQTNRRIIDRLESLESKVGRSSNSGGGGTPPNTPNTNGGNSSQPNKKPPSDSDSSNSLGKLISKLTSAGIVIGGINRGANFAKQASRSSKSSEQMTYDLYNTIGIYDNGRNGFSSGRDIVAHTGSPYGYDTYSTLGMQGTLIGMTGSTNANNIKSDTESALKTSRALSVDENQLTRTFGSLYQNGTYGNGEMNKFANVFASTLKEAGMTGREDEQLDILQDINDNLSQNLTTLTEGQYNNALGLYSMFSSSGQSMTGEESSNLISSLNNAITGGDTSMDVLLGRYQTGESTWDYTQRKEKGITDTDNLSYLLQNIEGFTGYDLNSDMGKQTLYDVLNKQGADVSTEEVEKIIANKDAIINGTYSLDTSSGSSTIDKEYGDYDESKLSDMNTFEAESLNAQEEIGNAVNEVKSKLEALYNDMPQWLQNTTTGVGAITGGLLGLGRQLLGKGVIDKAGEAIFGSGEAGATGGLFSKIGDFFKGSGGATAEAGEAAAEAGGLASGLSGSADDIAGGVAGGLAGSADDVAGGLASGLAGSADDVAGGVAGGLGGASKAIPIIGSVIQGGIGLYRYSKADNNEEKGDAIGSTVGGIGGGLAGASAGAAIGGALGLAGGPLAIVTAGVGALLGGIGGLAGAKIGGSIGESMDKDGKQTSDSIYMSDDDKKKFEESLQKYSEENQNPKGLGGWSIKDNPLATSIYMSGDDKKKFEESLQKYSEENQNPKGLGGWSIKGNPLATSVTSNQKLIDEIKSDSTITETEKNTDALNNLTSGITDLTTLLSGGASTGDSAPLSGFKTSGLGGITTRSLSSSTGSGDTSIGGSNSKSSGGLFSKIKSFFGFGSNAVGNDYVPYDGYISELHKGEMVLDRNSAKEYRSGASNSGSGSSHTLDIRLSGAVEGMTSENQNQIVAAVTQQIQTYMGNNAMLQQLANNTIRVSN